MSPLCMCTCQHMHYAMQASALSLKAPIQKQLNMYVTSDMQDMSVGWA